MGMKNETRRGAIRRTTERNQPGRGWPASMDGRTASAKQAITTSLSVTCPPRRVEKAFWHVLTSDRANGLLDAYCRLSVRGPGVYVALRQPCCSQLVQMRKWPEDALRRRSAEH